MDCDHERHQLMHRHGRLPHRRGASTATGLMVTFGILGTLVLATFVVHPMSTQARVHAMPEVQPAANPRHQEVIESLAQLIARSAGVVAVHQRDASPYAEIVLRAFGGPDADRVRPEEVFVLSHSRILYTITLHALRETAVDPASGKQIDPPFSSLSLSSLRVPSFPTTWRSDPAIVSRVLATGVVDMNLKLIPDGTSPSHLWIELTWDEETADTPDRASVLIDLNSRGRHSLE